MTEMMEVRDLDGVRVVRLAYGKANLLDIESVTAFEDAIAAAEHESVSALVVTGTEQIFSAGVDLFRVLDGGEPYLSRFLPALSAAILRLFSFPKPVVAAVGGHAIAGGCILACACDMRIGARGGARIGVPELRVGLPFPAAALEVVRYAVGEQNLRELVLAGETYSPEEALAHGILDRLTDSDDLLESAVDQARQLAETGGPTFAFTKKQLHRASLEIIREEAVRTDAEILARWSDAAAQRRVRAYLDRTLGRR